MRASRCSRARRERHTHTRVSHCGGRARAARRGRPRRGQTHRRQSQRLSPDTTSICRLEMRVASGLSRILRKQPPTRPSHTLTSVASPSPASSGAHRPPPTAHTPQTLRSRLPALLPPDHRQCPSPLPPLRSGISAIVLTATLTAMLTASLRFSGLSLEASVQAPAPQLSPSRPRSDTVQAVSSDIVQAVSDTLDAFLRLHDSSAGGVLWCGVLGD